MILNVQITFLLLVLLIAKHSLPQLHVTLTSVPATDPIAVVDPTRELLLEWFLSVDLCGSGTDLFSLFLP
jgi:hypothetical protein